AGRGRRLGHRAPASADGGQVHGRGGRRGPRAGTPGPRYSPGGCLLLGAGQRSATARPGLLAGDPGSGWLGRDIVVAERQPRHVQRRFRLLRHAARRPEVRGSALGRWRRDELLPAHLTLVGFRWPGHLMGCRRLVAGGGGWPGPPAASWCFSATISWSPPMTTPISARCCPASSVRCWTAGGGPPGGGD